MRHPPREKLELTGNLSIKDVPEVRRFVEHLHRRFANEEDVSRVAMATHELLENAIKFSSDGSSSLHVAVEGSKVTITTRNRARPDDLRELGEIARSLAVLDPMEFYIQQMGRNREGGLGIGRVAAECEMRLELLLDGEMVQIRAEATLGERA